MWEREEGSFLFPVARLGAPFSAFQDPLKAHLSLQAFCQSQKDSGISPWYWWQKQRDNGIMMAIRGWSIFEPHRVSGSESWLPLPSISCTPNPSSRHLAASCQHLGWYFCKVTVLSWLTSEVPPPPIIRLVTATIIWDWLCIRSFAL